MKERLFCLSASASILLLAASCGPALLGSSMSGGTTEEPREPEPPEPPVVQPDAHEPNDTLGAARSFGTFAPGDTLTIEGTFDADDVADFYLITTLEDVEFDFRLAPAVDLDLGIAGLLTDGVPFSTGDVDETIDSSLAGGIEAGDGFLSTGTYLQRVTRSTRDPDGTGSYELVLTFREPEVVVPPPFTNPSGFENALDLGTLTTGDSRFETGLLPLVGADQFRFELLVDAPVFIEVIPDGASDVEFGLFGELGEPIFLEDSDPEIDPFGSFESREEFLIAGTYFIEVAPFISASIDPFSPGYSLFLEVVAGAGFFAARQLPPGVTASQVGHGQAAPDIVLAARAATSELVALEGVADYVPACHTFEFDSEGLVMVHVEAATPEAFSVSLALADSPGEANCEAPGAPVALGQLIHAPVGTVTLEVSAKPAALGQPYRILVLPID